MVTVIMVPGAVQRHKNAVRQRQILTVPPHLEIVVSVQTIVIRVETRALAVDFAPIRHNAVIG